MSSTTTTAEMSRLKLWFALSGGAVAWTLHLLLAYAIAEFGCVAGLGDRPGALGASILSWMLMAMSAAMVALALGALLISQRIRGRARSAALDADERDTADYVARFGLITNGLFLFIIIVESVPIFFFLGRC